MPTETGAETVVLLRLNELDVGDLLWSIVFEHFQFSETEVSDGDAVL